LYSSPDIIREIKSWRMRWEGQVVCMGKIRNAHKILVGKHEGKRPLRRLSIDGRIVLKWILGKQGWKLWIGFIWHKTGTSGSLL
jgi:hypothetical protein